MPGSGKRLAFDDDAPSCAHLPLDLFFPQKGRSNQVRYAKSICAECPVWQTCRTYALEANEPFGIWGGLTPNERRKERNRLGLSGVWKGNVLSLTS